MTEEKKISEMTGTKLAVIITGSMLTAMAVGSLSWYAYGQYKIKQMEKRFGVTQESIIDGSAFKAKSTNRNESTRVYGDTPVTPPEPIKMEVHLSGEERSNDIASCHHGVKGECDACVEEMMYGMGN